MQTQNVGEMKRLRAHFYDVDGKAAEPLTITLTITGPDGVTVTKTKVDLTDAGLVPKSDWYYDFIPTLSGLWAYTYDGAVGSSHVHETAEFLVNGGSVADGPCAPWCSWADVNACGTAVTALDSAYAELVVDVASEILWDLSGRRYSGICTTTRSLCLQCTLCGFAWWDVGWMAGAWPWWGWGSYGCGCMPRGDSIDLGGGRVPIWRVSNVTINGATLAPSAYRVVGRRYLERIDGGSWPTTSDIGDPTGFVATWSYGHAVPLAGQHAAALFAREMAKQCAGLDCQLPQRVTSITREGVSYTILDSMQMIQEGRTGIPLVDLWIVADKKGRQAQPGFFSPSGGTKRTLPV